ncbi:MAG TPA: glycosyltransferase, partial [Candidatus Polarisedimenticolia bacterium]|nr:glycosyltransferase [Candidatus Polarisedimenticolia bacterium]
MTVSVVIPAYNAERFIRRTIDSVLAQTWRDLEVLVVDDGSSDRTADLVAAFGPPVACLAGPRRGVSAARNEGVRSSRGALIAWMDHDDEWEPEKTRRQVELFDSSPGIGLIFTQALVIDGEVPCGVFPSIGEPAAFLASAYENLVHWNYIPMSSVMVRRSALEGIQGPFDPAFQLAEDWDLWLRIAARLPAGGIGFIPEPLTRYRIVDGRATERMADLRLEDLRLFERELGSNPWLERSDPRRCLATRHRLHEEAGYWLLREGRNSEARRLLAAAWRMKPASIRPLARIAVSL